MVSRFLVSFTLATLLLASAGCGGSGGSSLEGTVPVSGVITYQGRPLADAAVTLVPSATDNQAARGAFGRTDEDGRFLLMTAQPGDGVLPGNYKVTISKIAAEPEEAPSTGDADYFDPETARPPAPAVPLVPPKYSSAKTTDLTAEVADESGVELVFDLKD
jgi:hypothetical protein